MAGGRERDGEFDTEFVTHLIEATMDGSRSKAQKDIGKLVQRRQSLLRDKTRASKPVACWFVTAQEPSAMQRAEGPKDQSVRLVSFDQFRAQLMDGAG